MVVWILCCGVLACGAFNGAFHPPFHRTSLSQINTVQSGPGRELIQRELGTGEQLIWQISEVGSANFVMIAEIDGLFSVENLKKSLDEIQNRHPLLRVSIQPDKEHPRFIESQTKEIPLRMVEFQDSEPFPNYWEEEANTEMNTPFPVETGPLVRCVWVRHPDSKSTESVILISFHHVIGDGTSGIYAVSDLLESLGKIAGGEEKFIEVLPLKPSLESLTPSRFKSLCQGFKTIGLFCRQILLKLNVPSQIPKDHEVPISDIKTQIISRKIDLKTMDQLVEICHKEKTTVHGALCAALLQAARNTLKKQSGPLKLGCLSPVNLRKYLDPTLGRDIGFYVFGLTTFHHLEMDAHFWDTARSVISQLGESMKEGEPFSWSTLQDLALTSKSSAETLVKQMNSIVGATVVVSNIGKPDIHSQFGSLILKGIHYCVAGNPFSAWGMGVAATTFNDVMQLNFLYRDPSIEKDHATEIVNDFMDILVRQLDEKTE